ncbi:hypothetical protein PDENDC454_10530 [Paenibacillus dendritiformis C454]|uniref:Uncharacterized protein n=1 Tax=Paenibacillus dendritiformis C454 TaxID=1131935 RepID=H3SF01_9BACL|nr:hypothetical protein [Paenibacillus dendritiformis]EHQ62320.1 hypothetical protein PDENDC454_10530 [Paenibacillus dendritiformis C454]
MNESLLAEAAFRHSFSPIILGHIHIAVKHGNLLAQKCLDDNDFLKAFVGRRNRAQLQSTAIEFAIKDRAERFDLELCTEEANNSRGTFPHYNFLVGNSIFTVSRTNKYDELPRHAYFRDLNGSINSQIEMKHIGDNMELTTQYSNVEKFYAILTFGGWGRLDFMHIGIPDKDIRKWVYQYNLGYAMSTVDKTIPEKENIAQSKVADLKNEFKKRKEVAGSE